MTVKRVAILNSEERVLKSKHTGRKYRITIALPHAYTQNPSEPWQFGEGPAKWPVVYLLDANWYFGMVTDMVRFTSWCGSTTDAIVVGIGYSEVSDVQESWRITSARRMHDYTPVREEEFEKNHSAWLRRPVHTGDAERLFGFIKHELIPLIERDFRVDPARRILLGHSASGKFALYALLKDPGLFRTYLANSPAVGPDLNPVDQFIFDLEAEYAKKHKKLAAQLYVSVGEYEEFLVGYYRFVNQLQSRNYKGLSLTNQIILAANHCEVIPAAFEAGLKLALAR